MMTRKPVCIQRNSFFFFAKVSKTCHIPLLGKILYKKTCLSSRKVILLWLESVILSYESSRNFLNILVEHGQLGDSNWVAIYWTRANRRQSTERRGAYRNIGPFWDQIFIRKFVCLQEKTVWFDQSQQFFSNTSSGNFINISFGYDQLDNRVMVNALFTFVSFSVNWTIRTWTIRTSPSCHTPSFSTSICYQSLNQIEWNLIKLSHKPIEIRLDIISSF